jgi:2-iminobutanoate/2-iminopropanoate deaminase
MNRRECAIAVAGLFTAPLASAREGTSVTHRAINPTGSSYSQAYEVGGFSRVVFVSGQVPADADGAVPKTFREQCRLAWSNVEAQLRAAGMSLKDLVKVTTFLSHRRYRRESYEVRKEVLGSHEPALTIIITGIYDEEWLLEIEAIAAR